MIRGVHYIVIIFSRVVATKYVIILTEFRKTLAAIYSSTNYQVVLYTGREFCSNSVIIPQHVSCCVVRLPPGEFLAGLRGRQSGPFQCCLVSSFHLTPPPSVTPPVVRYPSRLNQSSPPTRTLRRPRRYLHGLKRPRPRRGCGGARACTVLLLPPIGRMASGIPLAESGGGGGGGGGGEGEEEESGGGGGGDIELFGVRLFKHTLTHSAAADRVGLRARSLALRLFLSPRSSLTHMQLLLSPLPPPPPLPPLQLIVVCGLKRWWQLAKRGKRNSSADPASPSPPPHSIHSDIALSTTAVRGELE